MCRSFSWSTFTFPIGHSTFLVWCLPASQTFPLGKSCRFCSLPMSAQLALPISYYSNHFSSTSHLPLSHFQNWQLLVPPPSHIPVCNLGFSGLHPHLCKCFDWNAFSNIFTSQTSVHFSRFKHHFSKQFFFFLLFLGGKFATIPIITILRNKPTFSCFHGIVDKWLWYNLIWCI